MPTREQTVADAIHLFQKAEYPDGLSAATTWLGIYQTLLWYEPVNWLGFSELPHIIEANHLRPNTPAKKKTWVSPNIWQRRASALAEHLAAQLRCSTGSVSEKIDLLMKHPDYEGIQRQNTLGTAFAGLVKHALEEFGSAEITYQAEVGALDVFPGISFPGRSSTPRIDVFATHGNIPLAVISTKWSLRHDRLSDFTNECPVYKAAYQRMYRQTKRSRLLYYVITNEYDPSRLSKVLDDTCVDDVVHVHKAAVVDLCRLNGRLNQLLDLRELIEATSTW